MVAPAMFLTFPSGNPIALLTISWRPISLSTRIASLFSTYCTTITGKKAFSTIPLFGRPNISPILTSGSICHLIVIASLVSKLFIS